MRRAFLALFLVATAAQAQLVCPNDPPTREEKGPVRRPGYDLTTEEFDQWLLNVRYLCENAGTGGSGGGASMCSDLTDATSYGCALVAAASVEAQRTALGLGTAATKDVPASGDATSSQVVKGDDSRLTDARTPTTHTHDHGTLTGLSDDDHPQYALLAGRSGGQTLKGGTLNTQDFSLWANDSDGEYLHLYGSGSGGPSLLLTNGAAGHNDLVIDPQGFVAEGFRPAPDYHKATIKALESGVFYAEWAGNLLTGSITGDPDTGNLTISGGNFVGNLTGTASVAATGDSATAFFSSGTMEAARGGTGSSTVPSAGQLPVGNAGGTAYAPQSVSGDATLASTGALTLASVVSASTCGDATHSCGLTYDAKGRITAATNNAISGGSSSLDPSQVTGVKLWLEADAGVYKDAGSTLAANGETVQQWNDQSGNGLNAGQSTSGKRPTYVTGAQNSLPVIRFAGSHCVTTSSVSIADFLVLIVYKGSSTAGVLMEQSASADAAANPGFYVYGGNTTNVTRSSTNSQRSASDTEWATSSSWTIVGIRYGGSHVNHAMILNGTFEPGRGSATSNPGNASVNDVLNIGGRNNCASLGITGDIGEVVLVSPAPSIATTKGLVTYLENKWLVP